MPGSLAIEPAPVDTVVPLREQPTAACVRNSGEGPGSSQHGKADTSLSLLIA